MIKDSDSLIVFHDSLLPKYRGFAPLVNMLINGEKELGVTAVLATDEYDAGDILGQEKISIKYPLKIIDAIDMITPLYVNLTYEVFSKINSGNKLIGRKQNENCASYSVWRDEDDYFIDWNDEAESIERFCDAVGYPYAGAKAYINGDLCEVLEVKSVCDVFIERRVNHIGKVLFFNDGCPLVICGKGLLKVLKFKSDSFDKKIPFRTRFK